LSLKVFWVIYKKFLISFRTTGLGSRYHWTLLHRYHPSLRLPTLIPGIGVGSILGVIATPLVTRNYLSQMKKHAGGNPIWPEARLPPTFIGAFLMPISLFWYINPPPAHIDFPEFTYTRFAWTSYPTLHWIGCILAGIPFGLGQILLFLSILNYMADCYLQYAASALAANSLLRSVLGATFPLWAP
jgi:hypothetical protein